MNYKIFFSWQLDTDPEYNKRLVIRALDKAIDIIKRRYSTNLLVDLAPDRADAPNQPGSRNILDVIEAKIEECQIFLADLTFVNTYKTYKTERVKSRKKAGLNNNVVIELGQAKALIGDERIIKVMNTSYGTPTPRFPFPFDIAQDRNPIMYECNAESDIETVTKRLANDLSGAIMSIVGQHEMLRKKRFEPFKIFSDWATYIPSNTTVHFITHEPFSSLLDIVKTNLAPNSIIRVVGSAGSGKTRLVFEALRHASADETRLPITPAVLYYDAQEEEDTHRLYDLLHRLTSKVERFIFVIDNATTKLHSRLSQVVKREGYQSSLISIAPTAESWLPIDHLTQVIEMTEAAAKSVCRAILRQKFTKENDYALDRAVDFMGAFPASAILLTQQDELNPYFLPKLTSADWVDQIIGASQQPDDRSVLQALCLFTEVGYLRDEERELRWIANNDILIPFSGNKEQRWQKLKQFVEIYRQKKIIHVVGRNILVQPQHLALRLAEQWWQSRNTTDAIEILNGLAEIPALRTNFLDQFKHLKGSPTVQEIVRHLCSVSGYFTTPERVLEPYGSSLLRVMADISPRVVVDCLARLLLVAPLQLLRESHDGRRNLVWTLEKLCRYEATFTTAAQLLMRLAIAENEPIANNATGQFLQLFTIHLSGTEVDFNARINLLRQGIAQHDEGHDALILKAARAALAWQGFSRIVSSDEQLNDWREHKPTASAVESYWHQIIDLISPYALSTSSNTTEAVDILVGALRGLTEFGVARLVLPIVDNLIDAGKVSFKKVRPALKSALQNRFLQTDERSLLQLSLAKTEPTTLKDKLDYYVYSYADPTDYRDMGEAGLKARSEALVPEVVHQRDLWEQTARNLLTADHPFYSIPFARELAVQLSSDDRQWFTDFWLDHLKLKIKGEDLSPIVGFLEGAGEKVTDGFLNHIIADDALNYLAFRIVAASTTNHTYLDSLLSLVKDEKQPVAALRQLQYSQLMRGASREQIQTLIRSIASLGPEGCWVALELAWNFIYSGANDNTAHEALNEYFKPVIRQLVLNEELMQAQGDSATQNRWANELSRLIEETGETSVAITCTNQLLQYLMSQPEDLPSEATSNAYQPFRALLTKFFSTIWPIVGDALQRDELAYMLSDILGAKSDMFSDREGLLFELGDPNTLIDWYKQQDHRVQLRFVRMLPTAKTDKAEWHPFTRLMLDTFGTDESILAEVAASMNSFSVNGSAAPIFETRLILYEQLKMHSLPNVQVWARRQADICRQRIQFEDDWSSEGFPLD
ncbi:hypothetical protein [Fibrivirga algicola]|uniref:ATP-binding protein n=1 Tax=Fibrivirga algicola TaxID=2950420 RepID=A0ABX0QI69_9BACT|nr:hypothetical protein [Fibrivirga algicola]NID10637.1 hypothetical protein [Fibrivirga algicola]